MIRRPGAAMTIRVYQRPIEATRTPSKSCKWLGEAIVNGRDGEHAPDSGHSRDRDVTAGFDPKQTLEFIWMQWRDKLYRLVRGSFRLCFMPCLSWV